YGRASLSAAYGPAPLALSSIPRGLLAVLFDRQFGLITVGLVCFLALPGLMNVFRRDRGEALRVLLLVGAVVGIAASFAIWWAGLSPPARFLVPIVPALAVTLA